MTSASRAGSHPRPRSWAVGPFASLIAPLRSAFHTPYIGTGARAEMPAWVSCVSKLTSMAAPPHPAYSTGARRESPQGAGRKVWGERLGQAGAQGPSWRRGLGTRKDRALSPLCFPTSRSSRWGQPPPCLPPSPSQRPRRAGSRWGLTPPGLGIENFKVATAGHEHSGDPESGSGTA